MANSDIPYSTIKKLLKDKGATYIGEQNNKHIWEYEFGLIFINSKAKTDPDYFFEICNEHFSMSWWDIDGYL